jgi:hypothetical protein
MINWLRHFQMICLLFFIIFLIYCLINERKRKKEIDKIGKYFDLKIKYNEWIKCEDRLPDKEDFYLVYIKCTDDDSIKIIYFTLEHKFSGMYIEYWMLLPEPPNGITK